MASARPARTGFSPLDEELELLPGSLTPRLQESLVRLSTWIPSFAKAMAELAHFTQVDVSRATANRITTAAGAAAVAVQTAAVERITQDYPLPAATPDTLLVSADGAMVPLQGGAWAEVKTLAIGEVAPPVLEEGTAVVQTHNLSYFSRLTDSTTFAHLALGEIQRRGVERARRVAAVMDGAVWLQGFVDLHCPEAVRILDFPHAVGYLHAIGETAGPDGRLLSAAQVSQLAHALKHDGPTEVLATVRAQVTAHPELPDLATSLAYLETRTAQLQYPQFQAEGLPIGSGSVESAHTVVVEARLKGAGMRWARANVNPMLALRNAVCNDRWAEVWGQIEAEQRRQGVARRQARRQQRRAGPSPRAPVAAEPVAPEPALSAGPALALPPVPVLPLAPPDVAAPQRPAAALGPGGAAGAGDRLPDAPTPWRPAADHPWRRPWSRRRQMEEVVTA
jgi:hypothetical protein